jgi:DNA-binding MarR family transcriptional regulator
VKASDTRYRRASRRLWDSIGLLAKRIKSDEWGCGAGARGSRRARVAKRRDAFPPTVGELAEILTIERSALGQTLKPLERDGLIALARDERDGRRRPVRLTAAGREAVLRARPYWTEAHRRFAGFFGEPELAKLRVTLRDIAENPVVAKAFDRGGARG